MYVLASKVKWKKILEFKGKVIKNSEFGLWKSVIDSKKFWMLSLFKKI